MKAINNPLRPSDDYLGMRNARARAGFKLIARRRLRAAERELFRREDLVQAADALVERRHIYLMHHGAAARDLQRLLARLMEQHLPPIAADTLDAIAASSDTGSSRVLVQQQARVVHRGTSRAAATILAVANCAV